VGTAGGWRVEERSLVFGVFLAGAQIAGVYTRAGGRITGREAVFVPMLLDDGRTAWTSAAGVNHGAAVSRSLAERTTTPGIP
jgi:hypothetical protein